MQIARAHVTAVADRLVDRIADRLVASTHALAQGADERVSGATALVVFLVVMGIVIAGLVVLNRRRNEMVGDEPGQAERRRAQDEERQLRFEEKLRRVEDRLRTAHGSPTRADPGQDDEPADRRGTGASGDADGTGGAGRVEPGDGPDGIDPGSLPPRRSR